MAFVSTPQKFFLMLSLMLWAEIEGQSSPRWTYNDPENWGNEYPTCNGNRQSPIELKSGESLLLPFLAPIIFRNYDQPLAGNVSLTNNGYTVQFTVDKTANGESPYLVGGTLRGKYEAVNVHFHWGSANSKGAEHVIDGVRHDVEMHIVHKNVRYDTVEEASMHSDGLAVLGVFLEIDNNPSIIYAGLYKVLDQLPNVVVYSTSALIDSPLSLGQLLGDVNAKHYYSYFGSLTTPNCAEAVSWIVFPQALPVADTQIAKFWSILDANGNPLINNFRPLQKRNNRPVLYRRSIFS